MAAVPAVASAALTINSVSLVRTSGPPGAVLIGGINSSGANGLTNSTVTVTRSGTPTTTLSAIRYSYSPTPAVGASGCVTASNTNGAKNVNPVLPRAPGVYTISFQAYSTATCGGTSSTVYSGGSVTVNTPASNPSTKLDCGLRVALVLDESASINATDAGHVRAAANGFVSALSGTGASVGIIAFAQRARTGVPYTEVTPTTIGSTFSPFINGTTTGSFLYPPASVGTRSGTNWQGAFNQVYALGEHPDLIVFVTDGDPNGTNSTTSFTTTLDGGTDIMGPAVTVANALKALGTRVFAIGVGEAVSNEASKSRLTAVSGPAEFTGTPPHDHVATSDWTTVDFDQLKDKLGEIVGELCEGSLTVIKWDSTPNGPGWSEARAGEWRFTATLTTSGHRWVHPDVGSVDSASLVTDNDGTARFEWELTHPEAAMLSVVRENSKPGYDLVDAQCEVHSSNGTTTTSLLRTTEPIGEGLIVPPHGYVTCAAYNRQRAAHLTVVKRLVPANDPGRFDLLVDGVSWRDGVGNGGTTGRLVVALGRHTVSEQAAPGTTLGDYSTSITCENNGSEIAHGTGPSLSVDLTSESDDIVCTITNTSTTHGNLTVEKHLLPSDDPGRFDLLINGAPPNSGSTGVGDGGSTGPIRLPFGTYEVSESAAGATDLADYDTSITCIDEDTGDEVASGTGTSVSVTLDTANVLCTITNAHIPPPVVAHLTVVKHLSPSDDPGLFNLLIDGTPWAQAVGDSGSTGSLEFELGTYKVSESAAAGTDLANYDISTSCVNNGTTLATGTGAAPVAVKLKRETDNIVCTITNTRKAPPTEPGGGGEESEICDDVENGVPECGDVAAAPHLFVVKQMPAHARVGDRVPVTITVKSIGPVTATQVRVHETPPPGGRIVAAANHGSIQSDGTVIWNIGDLAPGESRTVHATMLITGAGLHTDTAVATAGNADPAFDVAPVRAAQAVRPPPFTG
ncbi:MAG TPA: VWA domain-containing protein [Solirubrobacteraceae bacterium]|nr:VWA domain-containing protein [Solirubrobacteraceae bacterium]